MERASDEAVRQISALKNPLKSIRLWWVAEFNGTAAKRNSFRACSLTYTVYVDSEYIFFYSHI